MISRILDWIFPALARRERIIYQLVARKRATRALRDNATADLRQGTSRLLRTLCRERADYIERPDDVGLVLRDGTEPPLTA